MARHKDGGDGEQIVGEFSSFAVGVVATPIATENHEPRASLREHKLQQLDAVARKPVAVHDHNLVDQAREHAFQNGEQAAALKVETGADVGDDAVGGAFAAQVGDLAFEVGALVGAADTSVDDALLFLSFFAGLVVIVDTETLVDVAHVVEALAGGGAIPNAAHQAAISPAPERGSGDLEASGKVAAGTVVGMLAVLLAVEPSPGPPGFGSNGPGSCWKHGGRHILDADQCRGLRFGSKDDS